MGFQVVALIVIGITNFINGTDDARKLLRCVVIINNYISRFLTVPNLLKFKNYVFIGMCSIKKSKINSIIDSMFRQQQAKKIQRDIFIELPFS